MLFLNILKKWNKEAWYFDIIVLVNLNRKQNIIIQYGRQL